MAFGSSFSANAQKDFELETKRAQEKIRKLDSEAGAADSSRGGVTKEEPLPVPKSRTFSRERSGAVASGQPSSIPPVVTPAPPPNSTPGRSARFSRPSRDGASLAIPAVRPAGGSFRPAGIADDRSPPVDQMGALKSSSVESYVRKDPVRRANGLDARLDRLIDVVADFKGMSRPDIEKDKTFALSDPRLIKEKYEKIFQQQVSPAKNTIFKNIEDAKQAHPEHVIFMHTKDGASKLVSISREKAGAYAAYDGCSVEVVSPGRSPFPPPSILFASTKVEEVLIDESAFDAESPADVEKAQPPKP